MSHEQEQREQPIGSRQVRHAPADFEASTTCVAM